MNDRPLIGDTVEMPSMGDDVCIEVADVKGDQPLLETDGIFIVTDQYGDDLLVERDGDGWVTANSHTLSPEGLDRWLSHCAPNSSPGL